jgi:hypothetical protein
MINRYYIVDNFYDNPDAIIELFKDMNTEESSGGNYAGVMTELPLFTEDHRKFFSFLVGHEVESGTSLNGKFRFTQKDEVGTQNIHFDFGDNLAWAGVIYMSKEHPEVEGTEFWKHKETGLEEIPRTLEGIQEHGWNGVDDLKVFLDTDGMDESKWDKTLSIPYKYNRLVLFRPWMFHSPGQAFGDDKKNSRIVQTFFLKQKG